MRKCIYLTEGECEEKLIKALKEKPALIVPGKVKIFNVVQDELPVSLLMQFESGSIVALVFDTDKEVLVKICNALDCDVVDVLEIREQGLSKEKRNNT